LWWRCSGEGDCGDCVGGVDRGRATSATTRRQRRRRRQSVAIDDSGEGVDIVIEGWRRGVVVVFCVCSE
jgi:hypothetical protein